VDRHLAENGLPDAHGLADFLAMLRLLPHGKFTIQVGSKPMLSESYDKEIRLFATGQTAAPLNQGSPEPGAAVGGDLFDKLLFSVRGR
jgi:hypothetical protein